MADEHPGGRLRIDPSELALEIVSIVIAIVLATAAGQAVDAFRGAARTHEALGQICQEIAHDDASLQDVRELHRGVYRSFSALLDRTPGEELDYPAFGRAFSKAAPHGFQPFGGTSTAWDLARTSDVLASVPYARRAVLQKRYAELGFLARENDVLLERIESAPTDRRPNFFFVAAAFNLILDDVIASEKRLTADDRDALRALRDEGACL